MGIRLRLPDFIGIGAPRCGTTWLSYLLSQHPRIYLHPDIKEIHYFDNNYHRGIKWYSKFFKKAPDNMICGEFTPSYMHRDDCIDRIHEMDPNVKIVLCLRDPVKRAFSHYMQKARYKNDLDEFRVIIKNNFEQVLDHGLYGQQLSKLLERFSQDQIHIIIFEEMVTDPGQTLSNLFRFLNLEEIEVDLTQGPKNQMSQAHFIWIKKFLRTIGSLARRHITIRTLFYEALPGNWIFRVLNKFNSKPIDKVKGSMSLADQKYLLDYYADDKLEIERLLGKTMNKWTS